MSSNWKTIFSITIDHNPSNLITEIENLEPAVLLIRVTRVEKLQSLEFPTVYGFYNCYVNGLRLTGGVLTYGDNFIEMPQSLFVWCLRIKARFFIRGQVKILVKQRK